VHRLVRVEREHDVVKGDLAEHLGDPGNIRRGAVDWQRAAREKVLLRVDDDENGPRRGRAAAPRVVAEEGAAHLVLAESELRNRYALGAAARAASFAH